MCGFCGELRRDGAPASLAAVESMTRAMTPRGPDGVGAHAEGGLAVGHRRLKIMDLHQRAAQPMVDPELGLGIAYNGAIYNHPELRRELEGKGYRFFTTGDTEVLLKAYHAWGDGFVERLNGMFAFALYERESGRVLLARDRLGIKPLYLHRSGSRLRFASTLPALLAGGEVEPLLDPVALAHYMSFHAVVPAPRTILAGVEKLPPATTLAIEPDGREVQTNYWRLAFGPRAGDEAFSTHDWEDLLEETLGRAFERRLLADVPVGALLSGGVDSSLVVAMLAKRGVDLSTFSIGFESVGDEEGDEFRYSDVVAERFATKHHKIRIDTSTVLDESDAWIGAMSEPMVSHDCVGFYLLSREVSRHVKVVQSGQGADELFAGYHWYPPMAESRDPVSDYARVFFDRDHEELRATLAEGLADEDHARAFVERHFATPGAENPVDKALRLDATVMLVDDPVKRVDNMTMAFGLEARVPFLDHEVAELAARIPAPLKLDQGGKGILKEVARRHLPHEVIDRKKGYFPVPALKRIRGRVLDFVRETLERDAARERGVLRREYVERLLADPEGNITPLGGSKLWQIALLERWLAVQGLDAARVAAPAEASS